jgi:hypothetical protein
MKTFFYLIQKCIKSKHFIYPDELFEPYSIANYEHDHLHVSVYIYLLIHDIYYIQTRSKIINPYSKAANAKLAALNDVLNNIFISNELKEKIQDIFCEAQRNYIALTKFALLYKHKKLPLVVANDLTLLPLDINHPATFVLLQNKSRYLFSMNDLINIIETAICNAPNFFASPMAPKNPYNNQKFNTATLCNIYFKMKEGACKFSLIIHLFFLENFVKRNFYIKNESFLREYSIRKYVYTSPSQTLYNSIKNLLSSNFYTNKLTIHKDFPKDLLVNIFRPYLFYYYLIHYSIKGTEKIQLYKNQLHIKLRKFYEYNTLFGRKFCLGIRRKKLNKKPFSFKFNSDHINFYNVMIDSKSAYDKMTDINRSNRIPQYNPDELFYSNELSNMDDEEYNTDYEDA